MAGMACAAPVALAVRVRAPRVDRAAHRRAVRCTASDVDTGFREDRTWPEIYKAFKARGGVPSATWRDVKRAGRGSVLVDIRDAGSFAKRHLPGSVNVPLYRLIEGESFTQRMRKVGFQFFGIRPDLHTERNPAFLDEFQAAVGGKRKKAFVLCAQGGDLEEKPGFKYGQASRSLKAALLLLEQGYNVVHVEGGLYEWVREDETLGELEGTEPNGPESTLAMLRQYF